MLRWNALASLVLSLIVSLASCSKKETGKEQQSTEVAPKAAAALVIDAAPPIKPAKEVVEEAVEDFLVIKPATLSFEKADGSVDASKSIVLQESGRIVVQGDTMAVIRKDGAVVDNHGNLVLQITADGVVRYQGQGEIASISEEGSISKDGKVVVSLDEHGVLQAEGLKDKVVYQGPPEGRRAMMLVFAAAMMASEMGASSTK